MGSLLPLVGKKTAVLCCNESIDGGMAVKTRRNGRRMKNQKRTQLEG